MRIGLTGGIGSGKSTAAGFMIEAGATVIDTDAIARQLTTPGGRAIPAIATEFGAQALDSDGAMDRPRMRELAFNDPSIKRRLEAILHPLIGAETQALALSARTDLIVFDVPLLVESGRWRSRVARVLVVDCEEETQIRRVMQRPGWTRDTASAVVQQQAPRRQRRACADAVIYNEALALTDLRRQVLTLVERWRIGA